MSHSPIPMVDLKTQFDPIKDEILDAFHKILETSQFINGQIVRDFSSNLSEYLGGSEVIPCANGTDALQVALMALDLEPGDEVITTPFTFVATAEVIALLRLKPVFVDVNPCTFAINEYQIEAAITDRTKVIIPVHLFGQAAPMEAIMAIAEKHQLKVIEDNAQAIGAEYLFKDGSRRKLGTIGHIGTTSFFPSKNLGAYGDAGAVFTSDEDLAVKMRQIVNHGMNAQYLYEEIGVNSRLDSFQAAVLNIKLKHLDSYNESRRQAADYYTANLKDIPGITCPKIAAYSTHVFHQYTILLEERRDEVRKGLMEAGIPSGVYYPRPLHLHRPYGAYGFKEGDFPVAESLSTKVLSLPMHSELTPEIQDRILQALKKQL
jgi:UDP-2-acetamido-2-deoxy-ribo-hexuluronate aminotransferase